MSNWKTYRLEEIASVQTGPFGSQLHQADYVEIGTPIITVEHLGENRITHNNLPRVSDDDKKRLNKYWLREGDIVFSRVGSVDRRAYVKEDEDGWLFSGRCLRVRPKENVNGKYLSYFFGLEDFKRKIRSIAVGATMPSLNTSIMNNIEVLLPEDTNLQSQIASILSSLDNKIELNLQMNQTLEKMAQTIFKEWCCLESDDVPNGWSFKKLSEVAEVTSSKRIFMEEYEQTGIPFYRGKEITQLSKGESISTELFISEERYNDIKNKFGVPIIGDILITSVGTIGSVWLVDNDMPFYFKDGNVTWVKDYKTNISGDFIFQWLQTKNAVEQIKSVTIGSTQQALTISALKGLDIPVPDDNTIFKIIKQLKTINTKRISNALQIKTLTQIRDSLLPKLMTGKIEIKTLIND